MPSYSGGLGVLAGDTIRAAADLRLPMVAISLLYARDTSPSASRRRLTTENRSSGAWKTS